MHVLVPDSLPVQELWDHIIRFLTDSRKDLLACSATCCSFTPAAQSHLFRDIALIPPPIDDDVDDWAGLPKYDEVATCRRLCNILLESPHLIPYIRRIEVSLTVELLTPIIGIPLSNLREVYLRNPSFAGIDATLPPLAQQLVGLPSVERVQIWTPPQALAFFTTVFASRSVQLRSLRFFCVVFSGGCTCDPAPIQPVAQRSPITELRLDTSLQFGDWFVQPGCPFDFSGLTDVYLHESIGPNLCLILHAARSTIQRLRVARADITKLDLSAFPALKKLGIYMGDPEVDLKAVERSLARLNDQNYIHTIALEFVEFDDTDETNAAFHSFDAALAARTMPSLQTVEVSFAGTKEERPPNEAAVLRSCFPLIEAKGILDVRDERSP
ncbi:hypothetical protein DFH09DRAFT_499774 [Mycena vulgaris]|nr:hypothetical protein DFH09DRAFT_499774 [Mycena vulgaris]